MTLFTWTKRVLKNTSLLHSGSWLMALENTRYNVPVRRGIPTDMEGGSSAEVVNRSNVPIIATPINVDRQALVLHHPAINGNGPDDNGSPRSNKGEGPVKNARLRSKNG